MNRNDIIRMAREAGFDFYETMHVWTTPTESAPYPEGVYTENLERFAALVAAAEREACAKVCEGSLIVEINPERSTALEKHLLMEGVSAGTKTAAAVIRARGKE